MQLGGASVNEHLAAARKKKGKSVTGGPAFPKGLEYLWSSFTRLHEVRTSSGFGPNPIAYGEIVAYVEATGDTLVPWEVDAIRKLDRTFMKTIADAKAKETTP